MKQNGLAVLSALVPASSGPARWAGGPVGLDGDGGGRARWLDDDDGGVGPSSGRARWRRRAAGLAGPWAGSTARVGLSGWVGLRWASSGRRRWRVGLGVERARRLAGWARRVGRLGWAGPWASRWARWLDGGRVGWAGSVGPVWRSVGGLSGWPVWAVRWARGNGGRAGGQTRARAVFDHGVHRLYSDQYPLTVGGQNGDGTMASKLTVIARRDGVSSTGTSHGLLIETAGDGTIRFTVTGANGTKRHAAVTLSDADVAGLIETLSAHIDDGYDGPAWEEQDA